MKLDYRCPACILKVATREARYVPAERRLPFIRDVVRILHSMMDEVPTPAHMAAEREKLLKSYSGSEDPYAARKRELIELVKRDLVPLIEEELSNLPEGYHRFRWLALNSASANGYEVPLMVGRSLIERFTEVVARDLEIDGTEEAFDIVTQAGPGDIISFIFDNAHEAPIDLILVRYLEQMGKTIYLFAKRSPVADDLTVEELRSLHKSPYIFGLDSPLGVMPERETEVNMNILRSSKLIIAKGMANYETLTEVDLGVKVLHLLTLKCEAIAEHAGGRLGNPVAILR